MKRYRRKSTKKRFKKRTYKSKLKNTAIRKMSLIP